MTKTVTITRAESIVSGSRGIELDLPINCRQIKMKYPSNNGTLIDSPGSSGYLINQSMSH